MRNLVHVLGKIGDEAAFAPVVSLLGHSHIRVRIEAVRALALIAPARAAAPIVRLARDVDPRSGSKPSARSARSGATRPCRSCGTSRPGPRAWPTWPCARRRSSALAAIGSAGSCEALASLARRRVWLWKRTERRLREIAATALAARTDDEEAPDE